MLRVNVGLSRKLSKDYNSTGYSVNLDGEVTAPVSDPEGVIEQAKELFDLAEELLAVQVERSQSEQAIASHDEPAPSHPRTARSGAGPNGSNSSNRQEGGERRSQGQTANGNGRNGTHDHSEPATNKQIRFLLNLGKQQRMSKRQLEGRVAEILGCECDIYDLTKQDACRVLETMTAGSGRRS